VRSRTSSQGSRPHGAGTDGPFAETKEQLEAPLMRLLDQLDRIRAAGPAIGISAHLIGAS
jgi:hypothetical protein